MLARIRSLFRAVMRRARLERELDDEVRFHLEARTEDLMRRGFSREEARRRARLEFGAVDKAKEATREVRGVSFFDSLLQDLRFGARMLRKSPGFTAVAVITLALGIGANTAIFSAVNGILLQRLPYPDASRLVAVGGTKSLSTSGVMAYISFSPDLAKMVFDEAPEFERYAVYSHESLTLTGGKEPRDISGSGVTGDFFSVMGVRPLLGRPILEADVKPATQRVAVLSFNLWRTSFGADPSVIGREITLNQAPYTVIGVMPSAFEFGAGEAGLWTPPLDSFGGSEVARLKPGVTLEQANAQLRVISARLTARYPNMLEGCELSAGRVSIETGGLDQPLLILFGAVGFVLLIACANVSGLQLARMLARDKEVAIREALGASRSRLVRQFLSESMLLALAGGSLGLLFGMWGIRMLRTIAPPGTPHLDRLRLDPTVLVVTAATSILVGILFGLAPAVQGSARPATGSMRKRLGASSTGFSSRGPYRLRSAFVILEVALAVILVVGATLLARSLEKLLNRNLGFRTDHILTMNVSFSHATCDPSDEEKAAECQFAVENILDRLHALPGVQKAAAVSSVPLEGANGVLAMRIDGKPGEFGLEHGSMLFYRPVSPDYFAAMGVALVAGRDFGAQDIRGSQPVAIVNESFARQYLGGSAMGHSISIAGKKGAAPAWMEIVGVVRDSRDLNLNLDPAPEYFIPFAQSKFYPGGNFIVRTSEVPAAMIAPIQQQIWSVDKDAPITDVKTMDQLAAEQVAQPKFQTLLLGAFGFLGLALAAVGIYGVISYAVTQRRREIGIRMALGAEPRSVLSLIVGHGMQLAAVGIALGAAGAFALTRFLANLLFEVKPGDPATFVGVSATLAIVALAASYVPARRAMRVDPMVALRHE